MELWIRSQDKKRLIKCEELITVEFTERTECEIWDDIVKLGTYKTKERALEVLDEIQNALLNKWANNVKYEEHYDDERPRNMVYEMPVD